MSEQLAAMRPKALCRADKGFRANFVGEAADDHGGPYREVHIVSRYMVSALPRGAHSK